MNFEALISAINPEVYENLKQALVLGKWADGRKVVAEQKEIIMEAIIFYENKQDMPEELRTGYISPKKVKDTSCHSDKKGDTDSDVQPLNIH